MRLRRDAKLELLRGVELLNGCSKKELGEIARLADELDFPEGKILIREGGPGREFFVLVDGTVRVSRKGRKVTELGPGDFFGEIALVMDAPRSATVTTSSPVDLLVIEQQAFKKLMRDVPSIQLKVLEALAARLAPESL